MTNLGRRSIADHMAEAATAWLESLDDTQRRICVGAVPAEDDSDEERRRWFYTPTDHGGLTLHQQRPAQQRGAMRLVSTGLSTAGYVTVATIIGMENILDHAEGFTRTLARERGRDPGLYYLRVFGDPGGARPWGWRLGGHHVSLNHLIVDNELVSTTPSFLGANPASAPLLGGSVSRPLARVEDRARELVRSLPPELRERVVLLDTAPPDVVTANRSSVAEGDRALPLAQPALWRDPVLGDEPRPRPSGLSEEDHEAVQYTMTPKGVPGSALGAEQRRLLRELLDTHVGRVPQGARPAWDDAVLDAIHIAWAGSLEPGEPHYYRLQGPRLLMEWDNTQSGANHAHSVWRDPTSDFGRDVLRVHHAQHHS